MSRIENFSNFISEDLASTGSKMRRIVTGQSAGDEIEKLPVEQQNKLIELYSQDPTEAAKYLRSIIIREKNSQFGLGLALTLAGAAMIYKAINVNPPPPPHPPIDGGHFVGSDQGGLVATVNKITGSHLTQNSSPEEVIEAIKNWPGANGDYSKGLEFITKGMSQETGSQITNTMNALLSNPHEHGDTLGQIFQGNISGTGKVFGDLMDFPVGTKVWIPDAPTPFIVPPPGVK